MVVFDNVTKTIIVMAMARLDDGVASRGKTDLADAYADAQRRVDDTVAQLRGTARICCPSTSSAAGEPQIAYRSNFDAATV